MVLTKRKYKLVLKPSEEAEPKREIHLSSRKNVEALLRIANHTNAPWEVIKYYGT